MNVRGKNEVRIFYSHFAPTRERNRKRENEEIKKKHKIGSGKEGKNVRKRKEMKDK